MSDPSDKLRQFLAQNAASAELAELLMEYDRRKGLKDPSRVSRGRNASTDIQSAQIRRKIGGMRSFLNLALEGHQARKKALSEN